MSIDLYTPADLVAMPEPEWLVEPFIPDGGFVLLFGPSGTYKSFVAIDIAGQVDGTAVYISAEGSPRRFGERVAAWEAAAGRPSGILTHPYAVNLLDQNDLDSDLDMALSHAEPRLLVIDTLARNTAGADENSTQDMGRLVSRLDNLREVYCCAVLAVHHTGLENHDRERGSSALRNAADVSIRAKRTEPLEVRLDCAKMRDAEEFEPRVIRLIHQDNSLVVVEAVTPRQVLEQLVIRYLGDHPEASQREVEENVKGRAVDVRAAYRKVRPAVGTHPLDASETGTNTKPHGYVRPVRPTDGTHPELSASQMCVPIGDALGDAAQPSEDGGW